MTHMAQALSERNRSQNAQVVRMETVVKSAKTRELLNTGVSGNPKTGKSADPTCYDDGTVELGTGLFEIVEMKMDAEYHITRNGPCLPHWPNGSWAVYRINGDQIADRVVRAEIAKPTDGPAYYKGEVIARHSWCGYLGMTETFKEACKMIEQDQAEQAAQAKRRKVA